MEKDPRLRPRTNPLFVTRREGGRKDAIQMSFFQDLFFKPYSSEKAPEVEKLVEELIKIGKSDDFLSERHTPGFNSQFRNVRARQIGTRLHEIGGLELMEYAHRQVRRKCGKAGRALSEHLEYCWDDVGQWRA